MPAEGLWAPPVPTHHLRAGAVAESGGHSRGWRPRAKRNTNLDYCALRSRIRMYGTEALKGVALKLC
jgi:hypothetical protein